MLVSTASLTAPAALVAGVAAPAGIAGVAAPADIAVAAVDIAAVGNVGLGMAPRPSVGNIDLVEKPF